MRDIDMEWEVIMDRNYISKATLGRLPGYLQFLKGLSPEVNVYISATSIAKALSLGEVQVRKDLSAVSGAGKPKVGYETADLIIQLEEALGRYELTSAVLVGAGKLGKALLDYDGFREFGVDIAAAFDQNPDTVVFGKNAKEIMPIGELTEYCKKNNIKIGIITVNGRAAQSVCDKLLEGGVEAIWNFAPCKLEVPDGVLVRQENLALSLAHLSTQLGK